MTEGLTVIVPNYNKAAYLEKCIESIIRQSLQPKAIIIVDDASTDASGMIIDRLTKMYPILHAYYKPENTGVSNTRNIGLSLTDTEYVTFIDADDRYYNKDKLALEMDLQKKRGGDIIAYSITRFADQNGNSSTKKKSVSYYLCGNVYEDLLITKKWDSIMRDYIVRTDTLRAVGGYNEKRNLFEDYELLLFLARDHEFYCTGEFGTEYIEGSGLSAMNKEHQSEIQEEIINNELKRLEEGQKKKILKKRRLVLLKRKIRGFL